MNAISLDTPIYQLTPRQLFELQKEWMEMNIVSTERVEQKDVPHYVNSIKDLAEILGCSTATLYRMKADGKLNDVISQHGKWMMIDVIALIEKFKLNKNNPNKRNWK